MDNIVKVEKTLAEYSSLADLKNGVLTGSYSEASSDNSSGCPYFSRCFLWKAIFLLNTLDTTQWQKNLEATRTTYHSLVSQYRPPFELLDFDSPYYEKNGDQQHQQQQQQQQQQQAQEKSSTSSINTAPEATKSPTLSRSSSNASFNSFTSTNGSTSGSSSPRMPVTPRYISNPNKKMSLIKKTTLLARGAAAKSRRSSSSSTIASNASSTGSGSTISTANTTTTAKKVDDDPLSVMQATSEKDIDELKTIILDIERIFPGLTLFQNIKVKKDIVELLFVWYKLNQDIGYRQGMHEIVSLIYLLVHNESFTMPDHGFANSEQNRTTFEIFNADAILPDTFHMFTVFMINPQESFYMEKNLLSNCENFNRLLHDFDYDLYYYLNTKLGLESQIWLIRWLRLLFIRELTLPIVLPLWDKLISFQKIKNFSNLTSNSDFNTILNDLILILLLKIKKKLIIDCQDYSDVLKLLLNYPLKKVFQDSTLTKKFDDAFDINVQLKPETTKQINVIFNEAMLLFNSRRNLKFIGRFLNEKYNKEFINLYETQHKNENESFVCNDAVLDKLRFENRLRNRVKNALK